MRFFEGLLKLIPGHDIFDAEVKKYQRERWDAALAKINDDVEVLDMISAGRYRPESMSFYVHMVSQHVYHPNHLPKIRNEIKQKGSEEEFKEFDKAYHALKKKYEHFCSSQGSGLA